MNEDKHHPEMVKKILAARDSSPVKTFTNKEEFDAWLENPKTGFSKEECQMCATNEAERMLNYEELTKHLPKFITNWCWSYTDINILRAAHKVRFGEDCRTETLFMTAAAGVRIYLSRAALDAKNNPASLSCDSASNGRAHAQIAAMNQHGTPQDAVDGGVKYTHDDQIPSGNVQITVSHSDSVMRLVEAAIKAWRVMDIESPNADETDNLMEALAPFQRKAGAQDENR